jgi:general secretion pathway protein K
MTATRSDQRGFALVAVLLVLGLLGVVGAEFSYSMRLEASAVRTYKDTILATHLAEAGIEQAIREIVADSAYVGPGDDGVLTFYTRDRIAMPRLPRSQVTLGPGQFSYRITDEEARLNLNTSPAERIDRLLLDLGLEKSARDAIVDSLQDWRDSNEEHRLNGAESDYYLKLTVPYRARNATLESVTELLQIKGVTPTLFHGTDAKPGLAGFVTVKSLGQVNLNTATAPVLRAMGMADAEIVEVLQARRQAPYATVGRFAGRGLVVTTRTFRVEAEGLVEGQVRARITAIIQKRLEQTASAVTVLEWSGVQ